jgi:hypothetical protein
VKRTDAADDIAPVADEDATDVIDVVGAEGWSGGVEQTEADSGSGQSDSGTSDEPGTAAGDEDPGRDSGSDAASDEEPGEDTRLSS